MCALEAGLYDAGGEMGDVHSAALLAAHKHPWPVVDLRVDWDDTDPIRALRRLWTAYEPQMEDYVTRAINPASAPSYGVRETNKSPHSHHAPPRLHGRHRHGNALSPLG